MSTTAATATPPTTPTTTASTDVAAAAADRVATTEEDYLTEDKPIPGQNYVCLSFVSPEKLLEQKETYFLREFWTHLQASAKNETLDLGLFAGIEEAYATFLMENRPRLETAFHKKHNFQTTVRGLKVRGVYSSIAEARIRAQVLQRLDRNYHVFVAPVGFWRFAVRNHFSESKYSIYSTYITLATSKQDTKDEASSSCIRRRWFDAVEE